MEKVNSKNLGPRQFWQLSRTRLGLKLNSVFQGIRARKYLVTARPTAGKCAHLHFLNRKPSSFMHTTNVYPTHLFFSDGRRSRGYLDRFRYQRVHHENQLTELKRESGILFFLMKCELFSCDRLTTCNLISTESPG